MFKKVALVIVVLIAAVLVFAATRPDSYSVQRSATIKAPPEKVFAQINDFRAWQAWSPWEKLDPAMQRTHSGAPAGKGAVYAWKGNSKVGQGRMEITESEPSSKIGMKLHFMEPFDSHNTTNFTLQPQGDSTQVTWVMHGPSPYISKLMGVFVSMDSMIGKDFEAGLANMKSAAEK
ncbi:MAG: SRPBCC family protein [Cytophagales bacterium]|nr:SRPBCC family protein [Rhizobacter sp.]